MDPTQVAKEVEAILAAADFESAVDTATQREQEALNRLSEQRYNEAFHQCDVAAEIYHRLSDGQEPDAPISIALSLAWA
ncbi:MAG: hypothetical protein QF805_07935, partial [Pirellulaceae bacterium]|nr:hypothetical protein [Pirellulaceae bacterium]